jgi:SP family general alpha glucoside:H+ symporter-like MFS transporter
MARRGSHIEHVPADPNVLTASDSVIRRASEANPQFAQINEDAAGAAFLEQNQTFTQAIKQYPKAVAWSMLLSTAIVMEGYDTVLLANLYGLPQFEKRFGYAQADGSYVISASWRSGLNNGANVGEILGLFLTGIVQDAIGYRKTIMGALFLVVCFIFIVFFATSLPMLLVGEILCGIPWGVFQTLTTAYAADVCPVQLRAYLTAYVNLCWVFGQLIGSGVLRGVLSRQDQWAYRIPFAIQWIWPIPLMIGCYFAPESPWWLVRHGRREEAKRSLERLTNRSDTTFDAEKTLAMIEHTDELEKEMSAGTSYWECFKGVNLRRTEICCLVWLFQNCCGNTFMGYSTVFYEDAGLANADSFDLTMGQYGFGAIGTIGSWFLMRVVGRRKLYFFGGCALLALLLIIGFTSLSSSKGAEWAIGSMLLVFTFTYDLMVGPVCYSLVAEISSTRLRAKTIVLARNVYNIGGIVSNIITNYQLTKTAWNWGAKSGFFWAGSCALFVTWMFFRLPEPKGRTYGELDILFERKVPARKFARTKVDPYRGDTFVVVEDKDYDTEEKMATGSDDFKAV